jgi:hypothetical protein
MAVKALSSTTSNFKLSMGLEGSGVICFHIVCLFGCRFGPEYVSFYRHYYATAKTLGFAVTN